MASDAPVQEDYESPFPECRVTAAADPRALVRLDMRRDRAVAWVEDVQGAVDEHDGDGLVTLGITVSESEYARLAQQVHRLVGLVDGRAPGQDEHVSAQVLLDPDLAPGDDAVSVGVLVNESQLRGVHLRAHRALSVSDGDLHRWEFGVSEAGAELLVEQLIAACNGAEDPLEEVDPDA